MGLNPSRGRISGGPNGQDPGHGISRRFVVSRTVRDMAAALDVLSGSYPGDPFLIPGPERPYVEELSSPSGRLKIGVALDSWAEVKLDPEIRDRVAETAKVLEGMGHIVEEIPAPFSASEFLDFLYPSGEDRRRVSGGHEPLSTAVPASSFLWGDAMI
ncbi:amidase family protein, partial [Mesorhizobium sp. M0817]